MYKYKNHIFYSLLILLINIILIEMFTPHQFVRPASTTPVSSGKIILEKLTDHSKSRWDEPIQVPEILYQKFKVANPSHSAAKQSKKYSLSLVDYIKRAYDKCKDDLQARMMQNQLRKIISKHQDNLDAVRWEDIPLPSLQDQKKTSHMLSALKQPNIKTANLPKEYLQNLGLNKVEDQASSKAKMKVSKTLQKLQEKLSRKVEGKQEPQQKKMFIGFQNQQPEGYKPVIRSQISPHLKTLFISNPANSTAVTPKKQTTLKYPNPPNDKSKNQNIFDQKFIKSEQKNVNILKVVTSTAPQPILQNKMPIKNDSNTKNGKQKKLIITRKQLSQISKLADKPSDIYQMTQRYQSFNKLKAQSMKNMDAIDDDGDQCNQIIVGRSICIDKPYLRITGRPDPETVRPESVLKKALAHFLSQHKKGTTSYDVLISQLKSIRQDLTVQHIINTFTVQVYEQNFKMSLFENDIIQVKQCQANLWQLYRQGLYRTHQLRDKFISYNFITLVLQEKYKELQYMLTLLPEGTLQHSEIQDSLNLKRIFLLGNYRAFFDYYNSRDQVCRKLLNIYIDKVRMKCLVMFSKTCGQKMTFKLLGEILGQDEDLLETLAVGEGAIIRQGFLMLKQSYQKLASSDFLVIKKVTNLLI